MFETLLAMLKIHEVTFSAVSYFVDTDTESIPITGKENIPENIVLKPDEILLYAFRCHHYAGFHSIVANKLFQTEFLRENSLTFDESVKSGQDTLFTIHTVLSPDCTATFNSKPLYHRYLRHDSLSHNKSIPLELSRIKLRKRIIDLTVKNGYGDICVWQKRDYCYVASCIAEKVLSSGNVKL